MPSVSVVVGFEQDGETLKLKREIDGGSLEVYETKAPCVIACNKGLTTHRYASLPGIMKAKKEPLETLKLEDGINADDQRVRYSNFRLPPEKPEGKSLMRWKMLHMVKWSETLLTFLKQKRKFCN